MSMAVTIRTPYEVRVECDNECGRVVTLHGVAAEDPGEAMRIAMRRLGPEGWEFGEGVRCRACLLRESGWSSTPGPSEPGHSMSLESQFTDHSAGVGCACTVAQDPPAQADPDPGDAHPAGSDAGSAPNHQEEP